MSLANKSNSHKYTYCSSTCRAKNSQITKRCGCGDLFITGSNVGKYCSKCVVLKQAAWAATSRNNRTEEQRQRKRVMDREYWTSPKGKATHAAFQRLREARKRGAVPEWADKTKMRYIYKIAQSRGLEVDHIVPLRSALVCGLHCEDNMRCISKVLNGKKSNRYWPGMPSPILGRVA